MALLSSMFSSLLMDVPGAPQPLCIRELRHSLERFCTQSLAWQYTTSPVLVMDGEDGVLLPGVNGGADLTFDLPTGSVLVKILDAVYDGSPLEPSSFALMDYKQPKWRSATSAMPKFIETLTGCTLVPEPSGEQSFYARVALKPAFDATTIDDTLFAHYRQHIIYGALATLLALPGQKWTNPELAMYYGQMFNQGVQEAKIVGRQDHQPKSRVTTYGGL